MCRRPQATSSKASARIAKGSKLTPHQENVGYGKLVAEGGAGDGLILFMATQTQPIPPHTLMKQMICAPWVTQSIYVAAELGIADLVAGGPRTVENLAAAVSVNERSLRRVLRALASVGVFRETPTGFDKRRCRSA